MARVPKSLGQDGPDTLVITWNDGEVCRYNVRVLRLSCPCAECVDEWTGEDRLDPNSVPQTVRPVRIDQVGRYALNIVWSDGHSTGIYTFDSLADMCQRRQSPETSS